MLQWALPENQLGPEAKDVIRLAVGLLVTMTALVLGMLVSTANSSYQDRKNQLAELTSQFVVVDRLLGSYGPETEAMRAYLRGLAESSIERIWPSQKILKSQLRPHDQDLLFYEHLHSLVPKNDIQIAIKAAVIAASVSLRHTSWLMFLGSEESSLSFPLLVVVVSWLTAIFTSFGLFAPRTYTVIATLIACAMAVSAAIFIILALYMPFSGVMKISPSPIRETLTPTA